MDQQGETRIAQRQDTNLLTERSQQILIEQNRLLKMIASGRALDECLSAVCDAIARLNQGSRTCFLLTDPQRLSFQRSISPTLPPSFGQGLKDAPINDLCIGTCGEAVYRGQPIACADIAHDDRWSQEWRNLCIAHEIFACHSQPVIGVDNLSIGSLMLCFDQARMPTEWECQLAEFGTQVASIGFEREHYVQRSYRAEAEKRRTQDSLRQSEERYRALIELSPQFVFTSSPDGSISYCNQWGLDFTGRSLEELKGNGWAELVHPDYRDRVYSAWSNAMQGNDEYELEVPYRHTDGEYRWLYTHASPVRDETGAVKYWLGIASDVTDRKQAEMALSRQEAEFRQLANAVPQFVWVSDAQGKTSYINQQWSEFSGLTLEETATLEILHQIFHPDDRERINQEWVIAFENGTTYQVEARMRHHQTGEFHWFLIRSEPFKDETGRILRWFGTSTDITETKRRELHNAFLAEIGQELTLERDEADMMQLLGTKIGEFFGVSNCAFAKFDSSVETAIVYHDWRKDETAVSLVGEYPVVDFAVPELWQCLVNGQSVVINDVDTDIRTAAFAERYHAIDVRAFMNAPFVSDRGIQFAIVLHRSHPYQWLSDEIELLQQLATRVWAYLERDRAVRKLQEVETRLQNTLASIRESVVVIDPQWNITYLNPQAVTTMRMPHETILGSNFWELFPDLVGTEFWDRMHQVMHSRAPTQFEYHYPTWNHWFENRIYPTPEGIVNLCVDITERKRIETELLQKNAILNVVNEATPVLIFLKDRQGRITYANPATLEVLDRRASEVIGYRDCDLYAEYAAEVMEADQRIMESGQMELIEESPDGVRTFLSMKMPYRNEVGEVIGLIGVATDISDRVQFERDREQVLQQEQRAREAAEQANRIKDEFLAVLSHELRSPLNPILGWSKILKTGTLDHTRTQQALTTIERNAKLQSELIEDLLDVSRILQGKLRLNVSPINLIWTIQSAIETVRLAAEAKSITIKTTLAEVGQVSGDATRLQQIVWNLLSNAVKFTPEGGRVVVQLESIDNQAQITITDTGKGIDPSFLPYMFDYFRQEDGATTRKFGGLGLGLAIVRHLVELHGGAITATSDGAELGATFTVTLPLMSMQPTAKGNTDRSDLLLDLSGMQVLVVDDEPDSRDFIAFVLEQAGAQVKTATSAAEAFEILTRLQFDMLLSDIGMPDMDGYMLMQQIRALSPEQNGKICAIALTAYAGDFNQQQALQAGFQRHLAKPIEPDVLIREVASLISV
ncbi:MAG: PAS domain-containing protein [Plectolyngbya sp. WJT66-NPBG17]|jgi:PAS domain S-box-containing protein|nr:PAS domain-containing protein [Plectolyngbya sp. WJT66-NPBG17]